ncbi:hypothetical protein [Brachybacterium sp. p3-SID957]|uniref:hypothetical protein n=1 Tax=Brachybacterium sp. p3-SID957 TaxID=2916049 RepID=UPI00223C3C67|nr:hypothetical protein [Brachybacterium sp. p3-SID957]MCT1777218.1 hypothetical protein [Brachybacterium sp. p3-SID957]
MLPPDRPKQPWDDELAATLEAIRSRSLDEITSAMQEKPLPEADVRAGVDAMITELLPHLDEFLAQRQNVGEYVRNSAPESKERAERLGAKSLAAQRKSIQTLLEDRRNELISRFRTGSYSGEQGERHNPASTEKPKPRPQPTIKPPEELVRPPGATPSPDALAQRRLDEVERRAKSEKRDNDYRRAFHVDQGDAALREGIEYGLPGEHNKRAKEWYGIDPTKEHDGGAYLREIERLSDKDHASQDTSLAGSLFSAFAGWFCGKPCCNTGFIAAIVLLGLTQNLFK